MHEAVLRSGLGDACRRALALLAVATLAACAGPTNRQAATPLTPAAVRPDGDAILSAMLAPPTEATAAESIAALPQPVRLEAQRVRGPHGGTATVSELVFEGLSVTTFTLDGGGPPILTGVTLTDGAAREHGLTIGMDATQALERFSAARPLPTSPGASASFAVEDEPDAAPYQVDLTFENGRLASVTWRAYLD